MGENRQNQGGCSQSAGLANLVVKSVDHHSIVIRIFVRGFNIAAKADFLILMVFLSPANGVVTKARTAMAKPIYNPTFPASTGQLVRDASGGGCGKAKTLQT
jgi:hypothetical protein